MRAPCNTTGMLRHHLDLQPLPAFDSKPNMTSQPQDILDFWFGPPGSTTEIVGRQRNLWFGKSMANDRTVTERFSATLLAATASQLDHWAETPQGRLALLIVFDQFPHHIYRNQPQAFATDPQGLTLALAALAKHEAAQLAPIERVFLYLPLEHAESNAMQELSVSLYQQLASDAAEDERAVFEGFLDYARKHRDVVARFGRFPHRNAILGRPSSDDELAFLKQPGSRF